VGYGLDFDGAWRHLPHLAALDSADIAAARTGTAPRPDAHRPIPVDPAGDART